MVDDHGMRTDTIPKFEVLYASRDELYIISPNGWDGLSLGLPYYMFFGGLVIFKENILRLNNSIVFFVVSVYELVV